MVASESAGAQPATSAAPPASSQSAQKIHMEQRLHQYMDREDQRVKEVRNCRCAGAMGVLQEIKLRRAKFSHEEHHPWQNGAVMLQITEGILYNFLPALLTCIVPASEDPFAELSAEMCCQTAAAALCVSCLLNAPPGFLEFLLCVPWQKLSQLHPGSEDALDALLPTLLVSTAERQQIISTPLPSSLLPCMLSFLYIDEYQHSLPPMLVLTHDQQGNPAPQAAASARRPVPADARKAAAPKVRVWAPMTTEVRAPCHTAAEHPRHLPGHASVHWACLHANLTGAAAVQIAAALLDGATPMHCAALRGNPAQVDHLLYCGAGACATTTAGKLPLELVPLCGDRDVEGARICRCMSAADQDVWECRSRTARQMIMQVRRCRTLLQGLSGPCSALTWAFSRSV